MKCVAELMNMRIEAEREWERNKILAEKELITDTFDFCENVIGPKLASLAKERKDIVATFEFGFSYDIYNNLILSPLKRDRHTYANGCSSWVCDYDIRCCKAFFEEYLTQHCFKIEWIESMYMCYGCGALRSKTLKVSI